MQRHTLGLPAPQGRRSTRPARLWVVLFAGFALFGCASGKSYEAATSGYPGEAAAPQRDYNELATEDSEEGGYGYAAQAPEAPMPTLGAGPGGGNWAGAPPPAPTEPAPTPQPAPSGPTPSAQPAATSSEPKRAPLLIYDAVVTLAVFKAADGIDAVEKLALESGGYLVHRTDNEIKVRVPATVFDSSLEKVTKLGDELHRQVNVRDVTEEFSDLQTRLQNARAVRARLEELLKQAQKVEEALAVEKELERVAGDIERILGRLKLLSELLSFSTITVRFEARPVDLVGSDVTLPFPWLHELGLPGLLSL